ncbi:MAG: hypothetical protein G3M78_11330 [Candidatus Nitrohelix vancouverensis]|uniref:VOC domain-containing protein n=1 Tax=Candidatus Nitrohelix vancouverensis TaxID=2705534 RepID=A0A7T0C3N4_9BACT|nr:MAG: hypothetical protein G3M78_11330 [Candidatus Nitrohelix vancouverensis]
MNAQLNLILDDYIQRYLEGNQAANLLNNLLNDTGVGLRPLIDHCTIRTDNVDQRALEFEEMGYVQDEQIGVLTFDHWWAKVYRKPGYPALFIDQAFADERGTKSLIPQWVNDHGDQTFHHIAIQVNDIEIALQKLSEQGLSFSDQIIGERKSDLRQIFSTPEIKEGKVFTVLELIERHNGYEGFLPPQADGLMESTRI